MHQEKESEVGHFISFYFAFERENGTIYLVDPQMSVMRPYDGSSISSIYGNAEVFDAIFYIHSTSYNVFQQIPLDSFYLRERPQSVSF
jgi:hypothetical protein